MRSLFESMKNSGPAKGFLVASTAGHDKGRVYLVLKVEGSFLFLADGRYRKADKPKKKRVKHVKSLQTGPEAGEVQRELEEAKSTEAKNIIIRRVIKDFLESKKNLKEEEFDA